MVCGQPQQREMAICSAVFLYLFVWRGRGGVESVPQHKSERRTVVFEPLLKWKRNKSSREFYRKSSLLKIIIECGCLIKPFRQSKNNIISKQRTQYTPTANIKHLFPSITENRTKLMQTIMTEQDEKLFG